MMFPQVSWRSTWIARRSAPGRSDCRNTRRLRALAGLAALVLALGAPTSASADWPERQVKLIVTFPPGSANDATSTASRSRQR